MPKLADKVYVAERVTVKVDENDRENEGMNDTEAIFVCVKVAKLLVTFSDMDSDPVLHGGDTVAVCVELCVTEALELELAETVCERVATAGEIVSLTVALCDSVN